MVDPDSDKATYLSKHYNGCNGVVGYGCNEEFLASLRPQVGSNHVLKLCFSQWVGFLGFLA
jgi:hypothetical protein